MSEALTNPPGFAIIAEFIYPSENDRKHVESVRQYTLRRGQGLLFIGNLDTPEEPISFQQSQMVEALRTVPEGKQIQMIAVVEENQGSLLFTDGTPDNSTAVGLQTPQEKRVMLAHFGRIDFAGIWGKSEAEATQTLRRLQEQRTRLN
jgi:hypothetical protein